MSWILLGSTGMKRLNVTKYIYSGTLLKYKFKVLVLYLAYFTLYIHAVLHFYYNSEENIVLLTPQL